MEGRRERTADNNNNDIDTLLSNSNPGDVDDAVGLVETWLYGDAEVWRSGVSGDGARQLSARARGATLAIFVVSRPR